MTTSPPSQQPVALVTGGSRGLGLLIARELVGRGYRVATCSRDLTEGQAGAQQVGATAYQCDVRDRDQVERMVRQVESDLGPVEVLIAVAGVIQVGPAETMSVDDFEDAVGIMLMGPVHAAWAVLPGMRERGHGRIGIVTSVGGRVSPPHLLPYAAAKFGAVGFGEGLAAELAGTGVTATTIVPGLMRTGSHERALFTGDQAAGFAWFGPSASLPILSMSADRAARMMVNGVLRGKPVLTLSWLTHLGQRVHGLSPSLTVQLMGIGARLLPGAPSGRKHPGSAEEAPTAQLEGRQAARQLSRGAGLLVGTLTTLGRRAARRNNQRLEGAKP